VCQRIESPISKQGREVSKAKQGQQRPVANQIERHQRKKQVTNGKQGKRKCPQSRNQSNSQYRKILMSQKRMKYGMKYSKAECIIRTRKTAFIKAAREYERGNKASDMRKVTGKGRKSSI
jgi:hypothetical protein